MRCKYNAYRTYLRDDAPPMARNALEAFVAAVGHAECIKVHLDNSTAVLINNYAALHGRDLVEDNRRLLIRLFGYSDDVTYVAASEAPLVVNG